jgi:hypothetical protein
MNIKIDNNWIELTDLEAKPFYQSNGVPYYISSNNSYSANLAVFTGKIFRVLLGEYQPDYHLVTDEQGQLSRGCNWLDNFVPFQIDEDPFNVKYGEKSYPLTKIRNLTAAILAGYFLGEADWYSENIGFVPDQKNPDCLVAVRIDPGCSFQFEQSPTFHVNYFMNVLEDPFRMMIGGINCQAYKDFSFENINHYYFAELFKDITEEDDGSESALTYDENSTVVDMLKCLVYKFPEYKDLLNKKDEIEETIKKICGLTKDTLLKLAMESDLEQEEANTFISILLERQKAFERVLLFKNLQEEGLIRNLDRNEAEQEVLRTGHAILRPASTGGIAITYLNSESGAVQNGLISADMQQHPSCYTSAESTQHRLKFLIEYLSSHDNNQSSTGNFGFFAQTRIAQSHERFRDVPVPEIDSPTRS